jgi:hypothetical protein
VKNGLEYKELPGWHFFVDEISAGVYRAWGKDSLGHNIEVTGIDPDLLLERCKAYAGQFAAITST